MGLVLNNSSKLKETKTIEVILKNPCYNGDYKKALSSRTCMLCERKKVKSNIHVSVICKKCQKVLNEILPY
jgi:hypothetical protein